MQTNIYSYRTLEVHTIYISIDRDGHSEVIILLCIHLHKFITQKLVIVTYYVSPYQGGAVYKVA